MFGVYHGAACGLSFGRATPARFEDCVITNPDMVKIRDKIEAEIDSALKADDCWIGVDMGEAGRVPKHIQLALGSLDLIMTDAQMTEIF